MYHEQVSHNRRKHGRGIGHLRGQFVSSQWRQSFSSPKTGYRFRHQKFVQNTVSPRTVILRDLDLDFEQCFSLQFLTGNKRSVNSHQKVKGIRKWIRVNAYNIHFPKIHVSLSFIKNMNQRVVFCMDTSKEYHTEVYI